MDRQLILSKDFRFAFHRNILLKMMLYLGESTAKLLYSMKSTLIETNDDYPFIISDNLMNIFHPDMLTNKYYQPVLGRPNVRVCIPISKNIALLLISDQNSTDEIIFSINNLPHTSAGEKIDLRTLIISLNKKAYINSYEYVFANSNSDKLKRCFNNILSMQDKSI